jgi:hypothetical protein
MPRKKTHLGKDALCSALARFLHPSVLVRQRYPNMNKTKRITALRALRLEQKTVQGHDKECVVMTSNEFTDNHGQYLEIYCVRRYCTVDVEGPPTFYFDSGTVPVTPTQETNEEEEVVAEVLPEEDIETTMLISRTTTIRPDAEDIAEIQGTVEIDDDNAPAPENLPTAPDNNLVTWGTWTHNNICNRRLAGASETRPTINFPSSFSPTLVDLFDLLFPKQFVIDVILVETNKKLKVTLSYG